jgi:hypothetical protein
MRFHTFPPPGHGDAHSQKKGEIIDRDEKKYLTLIRQYYTLRWSSSFGKSPTLDVLRYLLF